MKRKVVSLSSSMERGLTMYVLAASAAGVGMLSLAQPAEARIVYTKAHHFIGPNFAYNLDLNHDGTVDFVIQQYDYCASSTCLGFRRDLLAKGPLGNAVQRSLGTSQINYAAALKPNAQIGPRQKFVNGANGEDLVRVQQDQDFQTLITYGNWINLNNRYLGLRFKIGAKIHYGWARLNVHNNKAGKITALLTGYAYETIPNKPIIAGKTHGKDDVTLGHLATGASAIPAWRVKSTAATSH